MARKKVSTPLTLGSWGEVDRAFREIAECESCIGEIEVGMNRTIAEAKAAADRKARPAQERIKQLEYDVKEFVLQHQEDFAGGKTKQLNFGKAGFRLSTKLVIPSGRVPEVIERIRQYGMDDCLNVKETVNREALKKYKSEDILKVGAYLKSDNEFWYEINREELGKA